MRFPPVLHASETSLKFDFLFLRLSYIAQQEIHSEDSQKHVFSTKILTYAKLKEKLQFNSKCLTSAFQLTVNTEITACCSGGAAHL